MKDFQEIFYGEEGIDSRFRDNDFHLDEKEINTIKKFIVNIEEQTKNEKKVNSEDVSDLTVLISDLSRAYYSNSEKTSIIELLNYIHYRMEILGK